jgi:isopropylmalate/homocitrate/citramalate synthase
MTCHYLSPGFPFLHNTNDTVTKAAVCQMFSISIPTPFNSADKDCRSWFMFVTTGPRDGLQNEPKVVPALRKIELIKSLARTGLQVVEATSFVSPKWVPQMADNDQVYSALKGLNINLPVLVPNMKGLEKAIEVGVKEIAIFSAASDAFSLKNINMTVDDSLLQFRAVCDKAIESNLKVRLLYSHSGATSRLLLRVRMLAKSRRKR